MKTVKANRLQVKSNALKTAKKNWRSLKERNTFETHGIKKLLNSLLKIVWKLKMYWISFLPKNLILYKCTLGEFTAESTNLLNAPFGLSEKRRKRPKKKPPIFFFFFFF